MPALVETMAHNVAVVPWWGLGNQVADCVSSQEMLEAAGLNWRADRRRIYMHRDRDSDELIEIPDRLAIVRDLDHRVFGITSYQYHPVQNAAVLDFFKQYVEAGGMRLETAGALKGGAIIWALAKLNESFTLDDDDRVEGYLLLANSHDGSMCFIGQFTAICVVCWNTLSAALNQRKGRMFRLRHNRQFTAAVAEDARRRLGLARDALHRLEDQAGYLAERQVDARGQEVRRYVAQLTHPELLEAIMAQTKRVQQVADETASLAVDDIIAQTYRRALKPEHFSLVGRRILESIVEAPGNDLPSRQNTWWGVVNGVTHYVDHVAGRDRDTALTSAWFGERANLKERALELAVDYAKAGVS